MRLLVDENIPLASIQALRAASHDVLAASETMARAGDRGARPGPGGEGRVLVTFDRDFGALTFRGGVSAPAGIVLLRFVPVTPEEPAAVLVDLLGDSGLTFSGKFTRHLQTRCCPRGDSRTVSSRKGAVTVEDRGSADVKGFMA